MPETKPAAGQWLADLPRDRLLGEFSLWSADLCNLAADLQRTEPTSPTSTMSTWPTAASRHRSCSSQTRWRASGR